MQPETFDQTRKLYTGGKGHVDTDDICLGGVLISVNKSHDLIHYEITRSREGLGSNDQE